jgi:hypothetical protein
VTGAVGDHAALRCLLGHHSWRYAIMPNQDVVSPPAHVATQSASIQLSRSQPACPNRRHQRHPAPVQAERVAEMTTPPNDGPQVLAVGGGQILLRGAAVIDCWRAVSSTIRNAQRRDGLNPPARLITLERASQRKPNLRPLLDAWTSGTAHSATLSAERPRDRCHRGRSITWPQQPSSSSARRRARWSKGGRSLVVRRNGRGRPDGR